MVILAASTEMTSRIPVLSQIGFFTFITFAKMDLSHYQQGIYMLHCCLLNLDYIFRIWNHFL